MNHQWAKIMNLGLQIFSKHEMVANLLRELFMLKFEKADEKESLDLYR